MSANIHEAIMEVYAKVGYVQKQAGKPGSGLSYTYASETGLIEALRPAMIAAGIYVQVLGVGQIFRETYQSQAGRPVNRTAIVAAVRFTHAASATFIDVEAGGEGADSGDKSFPKAMTGAFKYALRQTFCIETGDDPDHESSDGQARAPARAPEAVKPPSGDGPACEECGRPMLYRTGESARGPWRGYFCPQGKGCPGKPRWLPTKTIDDLAPNSEEVPFSE